MSLFCELGAALFGEHWQRPLARALDVNPRKVARWAASTEEVPPWVLDYLVEWLEAAHRGNAELLARTKTEKVAR